MPLARFRHANPHPLRSLLYCAIALAHGTVQAQDTDAEARYGSSSLSSGFMPDPYTVEVVAGGADDAASLGKDCVGNISFERPDFELSYTAGQYPLGIFVDAEADTSLVVNTPDGTWLCNDDFAEASGTRPGLVFNTPAAGVYDIWVGAYDEAANNESVSLLITENTANPPWQQGTTGSNDGTGLHSGRLQKDDAALSSGEYADTWEFEAVAGQRAVIDLQSSEFDTYLLVVGPDGKQYDNDDHDGDQNRSLLTLDINQSGRWRVTATSYAAGETGSYTLNIGTGDSSFGELAESGSLQAGDTTLDSGEYYDAYDFTGAPGQQASVSLRSDDFDSYLIVRTPDGEALQNDDADGSNSQLDFTMEAGSYRVLVTSYASGETGSYQLAVTQPGGAGQPAAPDAVQDLGIGQQVAGRLQDSDGQLEGGEFRDLYTFTGSSGQNVRITLAASGFDGYLALVTPGGETIENDDFDNDTSLSVIEVPLQEDGRYRIIATSYASGETGDYQLALAGVDSLPPPAVNVGGGGRIFGIFAGMADYPGEENDLPYTDQDALRIRNALINGAGMDPANAVTLLNVDATRGNLEAAVDELATRMGPDDTLVFFYSGHGAQVPREGSESFDPDGYDETIELYDGSITDNDFSALLGRIDSRHALIVLDSCFSGGFAKDLISVPGRMGLFSSEEDVTSQVAAKFQAGGYLSVFFEEALAGNHADFDESGDLTAIELSQYLHERFRNDVKSFGEDRFVSTSATMMGYQHLVVDRGSIGPYDVLFRR